MIAVIAIITFCNNSNYIIISIKHRTTTITRIKLFIDLKIFHTRRRKFISNLYTLTTSVLCPKLILRKSDNAQYITNVSHFSSDIKRLKRQRSISVNYQNRNIPCDVTINDFCTIFIASRASTINFSHINKIPIKL